MNSWLIRWLLGAGTGEERKQDIRRSSRVFLAVVAVFFLAVSVSGYKSYLAAKKLPPVEKLMPLGYVRGVEGRVEEWCSELTFEFPKNAEINPAVMFIWDWGDEDGDQVEVAGQKVELRRSAALVKAESYPVEVKGLRDGYGGITVAVKISNGPVKIMRIPEGGVGTVNVIKK